MILCSRLCAEVWSELSPHPTGVQTRSQIWSRTRLESLELSASFSIRSSFLLNQHTAIRLSSLFSSQICNEMMILDQEDCGRSDTWVFLQEMCCGSLWRRRSTYRLGGSERWNSWRMGTCCSFAGANADFTNPQLLLEALLLPCVKTSLFLFVSRSVSPLPLFQSIAKSFLWCLSQALLLISPYCSYDSYCSSCSLLILNSAWSLHIL